MTNEEMIEKINQLKKEKNAVILSHFYTNPEIQGIADFLGDSLGLSKLAATTDADVIVFCGVHFMAETAAIISPDKKVFSPAFNAGCSLADSCTASALRKWKDENPRGLVVSYVNTTAAVKAETDYCVTSANALRIVKALPKDCKILFGPDKNLGAYISEVTGRKMDLWQGCCIVHDVITPLMVREALEEYPNTDILIHPEALCSHEEEFIHNPLIHFASTAGMLDIVRASEKKHFIIGTELGIMTELCKQNPDKEFTPLTKSLICQEMKKVTLEGVLDSLENESGRIILDEQLRQRALLPITRMMQM